MTGTFFLSWQLWIQMTFVLLGALVITLGAGLIRNIYSWRRDRRYISLSANASTEKVVVPHDIEARGMAEIDGVPFGIKALMSGIEVEGIWISQPNTPIQTPLPGSPVLTARPSPVPSLVGGRSLSSTPSGSSSPPELTQSEYSLLRYERAKSLRVPSFSLDALPSIMTESESHMYDHLSTLDALEGRSMNSDHYSRQWSHKHTRTYSATHSAPSGASSSRGRSPSPPDLTDGASPTDTPSSNVRPHLSAFLSESNHRMSHVAETGQIHPRVRMPKMYDGAPYSDASSSLRSGSIAYQSASSARAQSRISSATSISPPMPATILETPTHHLPMPKVAFTGGRPSLDLHTLPAEPLSVAAVASRHTRAFTSSQTIAGQQVTPILAEYMGRSFTDGSVPLVRDFTARHTLHSRSPSCSSCHQQLPVYHPQMVVETVPPPPAIPAQFRKVNDSFEVGRGVKGAELADTPPQTIDNGDRRKSRKLQKKRPQTISAV